MSETQPPASGDKTVQPPPAAAPTPDAGVAVDPTVAIFQQIADAALANAKSATEQLMALSKGASDLMMSQASSAKAALDAETTQLMQAFKAGTFYVAPAEPIQPNPEVGAETPGQPEPASTAAPAGPT